MFSLKKVKQHTGVQIATACSHHEAATRREAHRCIHRTSSLYRCHTRPAAEMSDDQAGGQILT